MQLRNVEKILQTIVDEGKHRLEVYEQAQQSAIEPNDLVEYGHKISYTTAGPPNYTPGMRLNIFHPPAPQEFEIRSGLLYAKIELNKSKENTTTPPPVIE